MFHYAAARVPAYKDFLREHGVDPDRVRSQPELQAVPVLTKENYVDRWPMHERLLDGSRRCAHTISRSSGSSGRARSWPRGEGDVRTGAQLYAPLIDGVLDGGGHESLLCVVAFAMGTWIAGTYTVAALSALAAGGRPLMVVSPGTDVESIAELLDDLAPEFSATLMFGYPPFLRDVLDVARKGGVDIEPLNLTLAFSGEAVTEPLRDRLCELAGRPGEPEAVLGVYGTADVGLIALETPTTIRLRRRLDVDPALRSRLLLPSERLPIVFSYEPRLRWIDVVDGRFAVSALGAMPLIRYLPGDAGTCLSAEEVSSATGDAIETGDLLALEGRADVCASFYGVNLYPEQLREAVEGSPHRPALSGRFTTRVEEDVEGRPTLLLVAELALGVEATPMLAQETGLHVLSHLCDTSSEYRKLRAAIGARALPVIQLEHSDASTFRAGAGKHRWIDPTANGTR